MTPGEFGEFQSSLFDALRREGFSPENLDVRLQGSSARFFSGEHKELPAYSDLHDNAAAQARLERWLGENDSQPLRRPFDSMYRLGLEDEPSDYDLQLSSDVMADACRQQWESEGSHGDFIHRKYGFVNKDVFESMFPALWEWADEWTARTGRAVVPALFDSSGPPDTTSKGVSSHFKDTDWRISPEGEDEL
jgi:hypothetical protein